MTQKQAAKRLSGERVCFHGKFTWGLKERLQAMAELLGAAVVDDIDAKTNYLVLPEMTAGKTIQKKANSLNSKGAFIQVLDADDFKKFVQPSPDEIVALIKSRAPAQPVMVIFGGRNHLQGPPAYTISGESFDGLDLTEYYLADVEFVQCSFVSCKLPRTIGPAADCDFTGATGTSIAFDDVKDCRFNRAQFEHSAFQASIQNCDFTDAQALQCSFVAGLAKNPAAMPGIVFRRAKLTGTFISEKTLPSADFEGADAEGIHFVNSNLPDANFRHARLSAATFSGGKLNNANFSNADLRKVSFADADLTGASFDGSDVTGANLRGAKFDAKAFAKAKGFDPSAARGGVVGPAMKQLDGIVASAKRVQIEFRIEDAPEHQDRIGIDSASLRWGYGLALPMAFGRHFSPIRKPLEMSDALMETARLLGDNQIRFETLDVATTKCPMKSNELRGVVIAALEEAFGQKPPDGDTLATMTKEWRDKQREATSAQREQLQKAREAAAKQEEKRKKQIAKKIEKEVGQVTDIATFLKALELRADAAKIDKATKMLKAERFQLFNDVTDEFVSGVVKSQTDPDLVYACRITSKGEYACCTQNLNICGGLRGSPCKHLLVLIIGLVKAEKLDPTTIDDWVGKTHTNKPVLDKDVMGEIFIRYKGAEAGEIDWRPTETLPEDYYAL